nr:hypothetical protein Q903MT_gene2863 [Picea sitchensis]
MSYAKGSHLLTFVRIEGKKSISQNRIITYIIAATYFLSRWSRVRCLTLGEGNNQKCIITEMHNYIYNS